jgi:hypothetical protein
MIGRVTLGSSTVGFVVSALRKDGIRLLSTRWYCFPWLVAVWGVHIIFRFHAVVDCSRLFLRVGCFLGVSGFFSGKVMDCSVYLSDLGGVGGCVGIAGGLLLVVGRIAAVVGTNLRVCSTGRGKKVLRIILVRE